MLAYRVSGKGTYQSFVVDCKVLSVNKALDLLLKVDVFAHIRDYNFLSCLIFVAVLLFFFLLGFLRLLFVLLGSFLEDEELGLDSAKGAIVCLILDDFVNFLRLVNRVFQLFFLQVHHNV